LELIEIQGAIHRIAREVRVPAALRRGRQNEISGELLPLTSQEKVTHIEDYMVEVAEARGELEHQRLVLEESLYRLIEQARETPWENYLESKRPTQAQVAAARRRAAPEICSSIDSARHLIARIRDQLERLDKDHEAMSRVYTVITG
jgi:hypothetical protein